MKKPPAKIERGMKREMKRQSQREGDRRGYREMWLSKDAVLAELVSV